MKKLCIAVAAVIAATLPLPANASERSATRVFANVKSDPVALRRFLFRFPKGGDLHNHLDGAIYAENYVDWAAADGKCIDLESFVVSFPPCDSEAGRPPVSAVRDDGRYINRIIDAFSTRNYERRPVSGHNQFFSTFGRFLFASFGREGHMLAEVTSRAARQQTYYLELMQSFGMDEAREAAATTINFGHHRALTDILEDPRIGEIVAATIAKTNTVEAEWHSSLGCGTAEAAPGCQVRVNYLAQVIRTFSRDQVLAQTALAVRLVAADPRYVGLNFVAPEDHPISLRDHRWHMQVVAELAATLAPEQRNVSLHAGELALGLVPPEHLGTHIREAIEIAGARRIGHGVDIVHDPDLHGLLKAMATNGIGVEINLTSNAVILGVQGADHPFDTYRKAGVPLALSTDDEGVSRIDLTHEYRRAVQTYDLSYLDVKRLSRQALELSFLAGQSLFTAFGSGQIKSACRREKDGRPADSAECRALLDGSEKARLQWALEGRFADFEASVER